MWLSALNMTWTFCDVYWDLEFEPVKTSGGQVGAFGGVRYLAWRWVFVLDFDNWSMGAKPWNTSGGQPVVFGQYGNSKPRKSMQRLSVLVFGGGIPDKASQKRKRMLPRMLRMRSAETVPPV